MWSLARGDGVTCHLLLTDACWQKATEPLDLEFEFREDVVSSNMTHKAWGWKVSLCGPCHVLAYRVGNVLPIIGTAVRC